MLVCVCFVDVRIFVRCREKQFPYGLWRALRQWGANQPVKCYFSKQSSHCCTLTITHTSTRMYTYTCWPWCFQVNGFVLCVRCVTGVRDWFVEDLAQVWLTRLIYLMLIKTRHGHVISSFSYLCHMINRLFFIFICYMEKMYGWVLTLHVHLVPLYCPSYYFKLKRTLLRD